MSKPICVLAAEPVSLKLFGLFFGVLLSARMHLSDCYAKNKETIC